MADLNDLEARILRRLAIDERARIVLKNEGMVVRYLKFRLFNSKLAYACNGWRIWNWKWWSWKEACDG